MASLDALPTDIQYTIFSYLICPLISYPFPRVPKTDDELSDTEPVNKLRVVDRPLSNHPYLALASQSRSFRNVVESYCEHVLRVRLTINKTMIKDPKTQCYRIQYLRWSFQRCLFCGKRSTRRAIFNAHMWCCKPCDDKEFGKKISKSVAKRSFHVREQHCDYANHLFPDTFQKPLEYACAVLPIYHGAMVYIKDEVDKLAKQIETHDPKNLRLKALKPRIGTREVFQSRMQLLKVDQKLIESLTKMFNTISLPADRETIMQLQRLFAKFEHEYALPSITILPLKRVFEWWSHLLPNNLRQYCEVTITDNNDGTTTHRLRVRAVGKDLDENGGREIFWLMIRRYLQSSAGATGFGFGDPETHEDMKKLLTNSNILERLKNHHLVQ